MELVTFSPLLMTLLEPLGPSSCKTKHRLDLPLNIFFSMINNQFKAKIVMVRSDNGTEFLNSSCLDFFSENGIIHQKSIPGTCQQNGVAERKHRHLLDSVRAIRLHAGFPKYFWGECILVATHIINKFPMAYLNWTTPFEGCMASHQPMMT